MNEEPNVHGTGRSSALAKLGTPQARLSEADPIEEPAIYEQLPSEFYPLKRKFSVSVPLVSLALMGPMVDDPANDDVLVSAPTNRVRADIKQIREMKKMRGRMRSQLLTREQMRDMLPDEASNLFV